jgi:mono/diheme cytochrome c family protein
VESAQPHDIPGSTARITGDARQGRSFAIQNCSSCHAVSADPTALLHRSAAPDFVTIAGNQDITEFSLNVWLTNPHPTMPMLILSRQDRANVAAYILSLRKP